MDETSQTFMFLCLNLQFLNPIVPNFDEQPESIQTKGKMHQGLKINPSQLAKIFASVSILSWSDNFISWHRHRHHQETEG